MMKTSPFILSAVVFTVAGCSCISPERSQSDCDQGFLQEQEKLKALYFDLLNIDHERAMQKAEVSTQRFQKQLEQFCSDHGLALSTSGQWSDSQQRKWEQLYNEFCNQNPNPHADVPGPLLISWDSWGNYADGEEYFRDRMAAADVHPKDALNAFLLSNSLRTTIGQYEMKGMALKEPNIVHWRRVARHILDSFRPDLTVTPLCFKLVDLAKAEIGNSEAAENQEYWGSAFRWAADAEVTARSAKALYELEMKDVEHRRAR
jgi:hypothetical protein